MALRHQLASWQVSPAANKCLWAGLLVALVGMILVTTGLVSAYYNYRFSHEAMATEGVVTKRFWKSGSKGNTYYVGYNFVGVGQGVYTVSLVSRREWQNLSVNGSVPVLFLPSEPETNRLNLPDDQTRYRQAATLLPLVSSVFVLIGLTLAAFGWHAKQMAAAALISVNNSPKVKTFHRTY